MKALSLLLVLAFALPGVARARVEMAGVFSDHMVLQRERPLRFYGIADPGERVTVEAGPAQGEAQADAQGRWRVELPPRNPGAPFTVTVRGNNNALRFDDVVIGEVWYTSGQSNMAWPTMWAQGQVKDFAELANPDVRFYNAPERAAAIPQDLIDGQWYRASERTVKAYSAVGVYFASKLQRELALPIGIVNATRGGSRIEPWLPPTPAALALGADGLREVNLHWQSWAPSGLHNGMAHALTAYPVRGILWYQGESNLDNPAGYRVKLEALISGLRRAWGQPQLPFYFAQITPLSEAQFGRYLPAFWEMQIDAAASIPDTALIPTLDLNRKLKLHADDKRPVGERFADVALARQYRRPRLSQAPTLKSHVLNGAAIEVVFDHAAGLRARDGLPLSGFELAGVDGVYHPAQAALTGNGVRIQSPAVTQAVAARFAWSNLHVSNLVNAAGLPALPFRTLRETAKAAASSEPLMPEGP